MTCPNCQTVNPPASRFCMECGTRLAIGEGVPTAIPSEAAARTEPASDEAAQVSLPTTEPPPRPGGAASAGPPPSAVDGAAMRRASPAELPATHPEWRMSSAGPLPEQPRRRWVVWLAAALGVCLLLCVGLVVWSSTIGRGTLDAVATQVATEATRQAQGQ